MKYRITFICFIVALLYAGVAKADALQAGDNLLTLSGSGASSTDQASFSFGASAQLSHMLTNTVEVFISDSPLYSDVNGSTWINTVAVGAAFDVPGITIGGKDFVPFVGASVGYISGAGNDTGQINAFAGARFFLDKSTFVFASAGYGWGFDGSESNAMNYSLGLGWRF
jgi:hypothetical protein